MRLIKRIMIMRIKLNKAIGESKNASTEQKDCGVYY